MIMATVSLRHIEKVYPNTEKKRKKGEPLKKSNLKVTDEGVLAVEDFNLEIADREFIVLVGPSGCGKSTTLRMVAGLEEITRGELYIDGKLVDQREPQGPRHRHGVSELRVVPPYDRARQHGVSAQASQGPQGGDGSAR